MITGFVTTQEIADQVSAGIANAFAMRGLPQFWTLGNMPVHTGPHAGSVFIPADDAILATPLHGHPIQHPTDFPEFPQLAALLGGLDARQEIDPSDLINPLVETL